MRITVKRVADTPNSTRSIISVDGIEVCHGLEDGFRAEKVYGDTRIPSGLYKVKLRNEGGMTKKYSKRFPFHRGMLHLQEVPGFSWVYLHVGNRVRESYGCILTGTQWRTDPETGNFYVTQSVRAYKKLYEMVVDSAGRGELEVEVI